MRSLATLLFFSLFLLMSWSCGSDGQRFERLDPARSGIHFSNQITESDSINILNNEYIYNGGGIAMADFDQDGRTDVYFTGNMVANRLYLNRGDFRFEDVTDAAQAGLPNRWSAGVAAVDINADGWMDLYVAATNRNELEYRTNALLINQGVNEQGIPQFQDMAQEYGLADTTHSTHAAFFDYDRDGDLDMYLVINQLDEQKLPNKYRQKVTDGSSPRNDRLYRQDGSDSLGHPVFTDVSKAAGILSEGFGLGVNITDLNRDGWPDIFVTNDYLTNDLLYLNQGDGTFEERAADYFRHTSHSAMGNDVADINNDGLVEIVAVDMMPEDNFRKKTMLMPNNYTSYLNNDQYGYTYQYVRNTLQLNQGPSPEGDEYLFSEISMMAGMSSTDWSWTPMLADFDNDGFRDLIITNGFPRDVTDRDFLDYWSDVSRYASQVTLLSRIPSVKIPNYAYRNTGGLRFEQVNESWGTDLPSFSNGAAYADLDQDGDLDYIVNNINDSAFVYRNLSVEQQPESAHWLRISYEGTEKNRQGLGAKVVARFADGSQLYWENTPYRGYLSSVESKTHFGLGQRSVVDTLEVIWPDQSRQLLFNLPADQELTLRHADAQVPTESNPSSATPLLANHSDRFSYQHSEVDHNDFGIQNLLPHKLSQFGPGLSVGDVNGDGLEDVYVSGSEFLPGHFLLQQTDGSFQTQTFESAEVGVAPEDLPPRIRYRALEAQPEATQVMNLQEEMGSLLFDADGDGDLDLYVVSGGYESPLDIGSYQDRLFWNEEGKFRLASDALPDFLSSGSCVRAADVDRDGDLDLFVGGRVMPWEYPKAVSSQLLQNDGQGHFSLAGPELAPDLAELGMVCDALWTDVDNDGWVDLLLAGEWMPLTLLKNEGGKFTNATASSGIADQLGWWNSLTAADLDQDGDMDYLAGNLGWNSLNQADDAHPLQMYAADFDENGGYDAIPSVYFTGKDGQRREYPFFGRADMIKQFLPVRARFDLHARFGEATLPEILTPEEREKALHLSANFLSSSWVENLGEGKFALHALPVEAQVAPVFGSMVEDFNQDGRPDLLLVGNDYGTEVSMGRYDALHGLVLLGDGAGGFTPLSPAESGCYVPGDAKALVRSLDADGNPLWIASQNQGSLAAFGLASPAKGKYLAVGPHDQAAYLSFEDGSRSKVEFFYGSGFLSQSSRSLWVPEEAVSVEMVNDLGERREM